MLDSHTSLGIAQTVFYVPIVPLAIYMLVRNWANRPRMAWYPPVPFSLMRLAGGALVIALGHSPGNVGLIIAALILLNVGTIPLIIATLGMVRIVLMDNYSHHPISNKIGRIMRVCFLAAAGLLSAGGGVGGSATNQSGRNLGRILSLVGYIIFAAVLLTLIAMTLYLFRRRATLYPSSQKVVKGVLLAAPFLIVRNIYGILEVVFEFQANTPWSPLYGSATAFGLMALLMEYIVIIIYFYVGLSMPPDRGVPRGAAAQRGEELQQSADEEQRFGFQSKGPSRT